MNRNDFLRMIDNSGPADRQSVGEVSELIDIFPYFQSAYMLLLKGLKNTSDVRFENHLRISAMHIADREVLYYFLEKSENVIEKPGIAVVRQPVAEPVREESQQVVIEMAKNSEDLISEFDKEAGSVKQPESATNGSTEIPRIFTIHAESDSSDSIATVFVIDEESGEEEERVIFMDPGFAAPADEMEDLLELDIDEIISHPDHAAEKEAQQLKEDVDLRKLQTDLIDKFILANPRIEPVREKTESVHTDISKPFTEEKGGIITETLARIYANQGYYSKAIDIYEKLSLKFPEKSSYFASQIEKVKELIKK